MTTGLRVASANLEFGGYDGPGDDSRWRRTITALADWDAHVVLIQEMTAPVAAGTWAHLWRTANELGMIPVLGPPLAHAVTRTHPAILIRIRAGLRIVDAGPPPFPAPGAVPSAWCQALVTVPGSPHPVAFYSVHLPHRSAAEQLAQAQRLATTVAQRGEHAIIGGDFNSFAPGPGDDYPHSRLEEMPLHLRPARMHAAPRPGHVLLTPDFSTHNALAATGLVDAAAHLPDDRRIPADLTATTSHGDHGRIDRFYVPEELRDALTGYEQKRTGGSDHQALLLTLDLSQLAEVAPRGPRK